MDDPAYAVELFEHHIAKAGFEPFPGFVGLELGPGDSLASAVIAKAFGSRSTYLVDVGAFANGGMRTYRALGILLRDRGLHPPDVESAASITDLLRQSDGIYLTSGLSSLRTLPDQSVDFAWSHAVLEHVRRELFDETLRELRRVMRPGGASSHRIDLEDHLAESINHLRFSRRVWESWTFRNSGFYTNRLRRSEILKSAHSAGFDVDMELHMWPSLPVDRSKLAPDFRMLPDEELRVRAIDLVLLRP